jgi:hypothetical protein
MTDPVRDTDQLKEQAAALQRAIDIRWPTEKTRRDERRAELEISRLSLLPSSPPCGYPVRHGG